MKKLATIISLVFCGLTALAQTSGLPAPSVTTTYTNAASTGTTVNTLTKLTSAPSTAVISSTSDTSGVIGVTTAGAGTTGTAYIQVAGVASLVMDGATTAGDYVQISSTTAGNGHDAGASCPSSGQVVGRVLSTNGGAGTYLVNLGSNGCGGGGGGGGTTTTIPLPLTTAATGSGMIHLTDSTGPGGVVIASGDPNVTRPCPSTPNTVGLAYVRTDVTPHTGFMCTSSGWIPGLPTGSSTETLFFMANQLSSSQISTTDFPYYGTRYSNSSGIINTGNAGCPDVDAAELYPWENPPDSSAYTYIFQEGIGTALNWAGTIGWGSYTNGALVEQGCDIAHMMWAGTPKDGKYLAQNATLGGSGTWTAFNPTTVSTTGTASSNSTTLTVASATGLAQYYQIADTTNPAAIPANSYIQSITGTTITLPYATTAAIAGDTLVFTNQSTSPWRGGVAECGTTGATLTWNLQPSSGSVYIAAWYKNNGTDTATYSIDGVSQGTITDGIGAIAGVHQSNMWFGQRFSLTGTGAHTVLITVTAGSFCPMFAVTPTPSSWGGMSQPKVVQEVMATEGSNFFYSGVSASQAAIIAQGQLDGFNVVPWNQASGFPEGNGTLTFEHTIGCYTNLTICSNYAAQPHYNDVGNLFNAETQARAAGFTNNPPPTVVDDGTGYLNVSQTASYTKVGLNTTNVDILNRANTHTTGNQQTNTGNAANVGQLVQGSVGSATLSTYVRSGSLTAQSPTICDNHTTPVTITAGDMMLFTLALNGGPFGATGYTVTTTAGDSFPVNSSSTNLILNVADGVSVAVIGPFIGGTSQTVTVNTTGSGFNCNSAGYDELANVNTTHPINSSVGYYLNGVVPSSVSMGPITVTNPNDLLLTRYYTGCTGTEGTPNNGGGLTWAAFGGSPNCTFSATNPPSGNYTVTWTPGGIGAGSDRRGFFVALNGTLVAGQTGDGFAVNDPFGVRLGGLKGGSGRSYVVGCTVNQVQSADGTTCINIGDVLLFETTASAAATVPVVTRNVGAQSGAIFQSDFDTYRVEFINFVPSAASSNITAQVSTNGGSSYVTTTNYNCACNRFISSTSATCGSATESSLEITGGCGTDFVSTTAANGGLNATYYFKSPLSTTVFKHFYGTSGFSNAATGNAEGGQCASYYNSSSSAVNAFQIIPTSGTLTGTIRVYGLAK